MIFSKYCIVNSSIVSADVLQRVQLLRAEEARLLLRRQDRRMKIQLVSIRMKFPVDWRLYAFLFFRHMKYDRFLSSFLLNFGYFQRPPNGSNG